MAPWKIAPPLRAPIRRFRGRPSLISIRIRRRWLGWPSPTAVLLHRPSQLGLSHIVLGRLCLHSPLPQVLRAILSPLCGGIQNAEPPLRPAGSKRSGGAWCWLPLVNPFSFSKVSATSANAAQGHWAGIVTKGFLSEGYSGAWGVLTSCSPDLQSARSTSSSSTPRENTNTTRLIFLLKVGGNLQ